MRGREEGRSSIMSDVERSLPRWGEREGGREERYMCVRSRTDLSQGGVRGREEGRSSICVSDAEQISPKVG